MLLGLAVPCGWADRLGSGRLRASVVGQGKALDVQWAQFFAPRVEPRAWRSTNLLGGESMDSRHGMDGLEAALELRLAACAGELGRGIWGVTPLARAFTDCESRVGLPTLDRRLAYMK
jgi:hypothetical protein